ncbi:MAG TPA: response regulator, partial [Anaerolineae bacterium]|nr:response regulator [Anaerolineae bacterium]
MGRLQGFKVLIIEDEPQQRKLTCRAFSWAKAETFTATSGIEGLQKLYTHRPDLITLDPTIPDMDGFELCRRIRVLSNTPIVILSSRSEDTEIIRSLRSGADDYITKPFNPFILISR